MIYAYFIDNRAFIDCQLVLASDNDENDNQDNFGSSSSDLYEPNETSTSDSSADEEHQVNRK